MKAFNVWLAGKLIDTVFYSIDKNETIPQAIERVKASLISHDGYSQNIRVTWPKGQRVTSDIWELRGDYGYGHGFEVLCSETSPREIRQRKKEYLENDSMVKRLTIVKKRERG